MRRPIEKTLLDKAIETVAPQWGLRRFKARAALALTGGYHGASRSRPALSGWNPGLGDADADTSPDLPLLRARCRDLARNAPLTAGALNTVVTNVVGTGLSMRPAIDAGALGLTAEQAAEWQNETEREWRLWAESTDCDATRTQDFYGLQDLAFRSALESGDVFALTPSLADARRVYRLAVQLIEADRVCNPNWGADHAGLVAGVEVGAYGAPVAYHICRTHPGAVMRGVKGLQWDRVPAFGANSGRRNVLHLYRRLRPGQTRGVPYFATVIEPLKQLTRYTEAEIQAAVINAAFAIFIKMDPEAFETLFDEPSRASYINSATGWNGSIPEADMIHPGKAVNLLPGEEPVAPDLSRPNANFDPFVQAMMRQVGMALELPFEVLVKHFTSSYSAARAALLDAWKFFRGRREWLATNFCQPVYELWLAEAVATGRVAAPGFFADPRIRAAYSRARWVGDGPGSIDPLKEVQAARDRVALGISTLEAEAILHDGQDWEIKHHQLVREKQMRDRDGLNVAPAPAEPVPDPEDRPDPPAGQATSIVVHTPDVNVTAPPVQVSLTLPPRQNGKLSFTRRPDGSVDMTESDHE